MLSRLMRKFKGTKDRRMWHPRLLETFYDVVIIGGGVHGLATAYFLARDHGIRNVAVIEPRYVGFGGSEVDTAVVWSNRRSKQDFRLYEEGLKMWPRLVEELDFNLMFSNIGNLNLAHSEPEVAALRMITATAQYMGVRSEFLTPEECGKLIPVLDISGRPRFPVMGGMYHPSGGTVCHDAVVWALARGADRLGVHIHQETEVLGLKVNEGKVASVMTDKGEIETPLVLNAAGGYSPSISALAGIDLPVTRLPLHALVTEPLKPILGPVICSGRYRVYAYQGLTAEIVTGAHMARSSYTTRRQTKDMKHEAEALTDLIPCLKGARFARTCVGLADTTPDSAPIISDSEIQGYFMDCGWGWYGLASGPAAGRYMARWLATGRRPESLESFGLNRFSGYDLHNVFSPSARSNRDG